MYELDPEVALRNSPNTGSGIFLAILLSIGIGVSTFYYITKPDEKDKGKTTNEQIVDPGCDITRTDNGIFSCIEKVCVQTKERMDYEFSAAAGKPVFEDHCRKYEYRVKYKVLLHE